MSFGVGAIANEYPGRSFSYLAQLDSSTQKFRSNLLDIIHFEHEAGGILSYFALAATMEGESTFSGIERLPVFVAVVITVAGKCHRQAEFVAIEFNLRIHILDEQNDLADMP